MNEGPSTKLVKPRTKAGKRALEKRAPKLVRRARMAPAWPHPLALADCRDALQRAPGRRAHWACIAAAAACWPLAPNDNRPPPPPARLQVEEPRKALLVFGGRTSAVLKDVMTDLHKLKGVRGRSPLRCPSRRSCRRRRRPPPAAAESRLSLASCTPLLLPKQTDAVKFTRNNPDMRPFEAGGESTLEMHCARHDCSLFALGT